MAKQIQLRRGTTTESTAFIGAVGEVTVDTDKDVLVVHDGVTAGGFPVAARANTDGTISLIKKDGTIISSINATGLFNNTLTSTAADQALTAAQGKVLKDLADTKLTTTSAFGVGQTWQDVTSIRVLNTTYTNTSGRTIALSVDATTGNGHTLGLKVNNIDICNTSVSAGTTTLFTLIPNLSTYSISQAGGSPYFSRAMEFK